jgi:hypothetical protein
MLNNTEGRVSNSTRSSHLKPIRHFRNIWHIGPAAGEKITDESWVLRDKWQTVNVKRGGYHSLVTRPRRLKSSGVKSSIDKALWKQGIRITPSRRHDFKECHGFRKYCKTYAQRTMKEVDVERLLGHAGNWSNAAYNRPPNDWLVEEYLKAVPDLPYKDR